jgi:hypothetical protein
MKNREFLERLRALEGSFVLFVAFVRVALDFGASADWIFDLQ